MNFVILIVQSYTCMTNSVFGFIKNLRSRKTITITLISLIFLLYLSTSYLLPAHRHFHTSQVQDRALNPKTCLENSIEKWRILMQQSDAIMKEYPGAPTENVFFPFTGNGFIGFSSEGSFSKFFLLDQKDFTEISFAPIVDVKISEPTSQNEQILVLNIVEGTVHRLTGYKVNRSCVVVEETFYAHRFHKSLFIQSIEVTNSAKMPIHAELSLVTNSDNTKQLTKKIDTIFDGIKVLSVHGVEEHETKIVNFTSVISNFQALLRIPQQSKNKVDVLSITNFSFIPIITSNRNRKSISSAVTNLFQKESLDLLTSVLNIKVETLLEQHLKGWSEIWKVGVSIASDSDPDSPTSLHVNLTEYYIYSISVYNLSSNILQNDCFSGPPTIRNAALWVMPTDLKSLYQIRQSWENLFRRSGCILNDVASFVSYREAMALSFIGLQYQPYHLQLSFNPLNLRSNISVRNLPLTLFKSRDLLGLKLIVNKVTPDQFLLVSCDGQHNPPIYICSTACRNVVLVGSTSLSLPVFTTDPVTPLLYISTNKTHLQKLGNTPFMLMALENAKASHQSHLEAHHFKLSPKFWLSIVVLIVAFHVIVIKMIFNEFRKKRVEPRKRGFYIS
ncbi:uncharacterized protein KIAA2013 homolog [Hydra vulgaris]|uniref:uncharacterized protein KIAA2013 homolog n=1 Tax=Hydra vulgaris TaxID=6087 RepID=UPI001F5E75B9|nr:uncharacterized protein KIAA2013 homolog [Hydra vulgaris]